MTTAPHETTAPRQGRTGRPDRAAGTGPGRGAGGPAVPVAGDAAASRESPAGHLARACAAASVAGVVTLRELPFLPQAEIRARHEPTATRALGPLPAPGRAVTHAGYTLLWCGPSWYLAVAEPPAPASLAAWDRVLPWDAEGPDLDVVDTSAARTTLELRGPRAPDVLAHVCHIDLHPRSFPPGAAARTPLARVAVVLHHRYAGTYRVHAGASYADHLTRHLLDAMTPYVTEA